MTASAKVFDVTAIGEGQLRLGSGMGTALESANALSVTVAGAEGNVLSLLSRLGRRTGLFSSLPSTPLGRRVVEEWRAAGVDTSAILWQQDGRLALYFVEEASPPVPSRVFFDRKDSCFTRLTTADIAWDYLAAGRLVHLTGITAALGRDLKTIVQSVAERAKTSGQLVSVDVNYRSALSTPEDARTSMSQLLDLADVIACSKRDAETLFGFVGSSQVIATKLQQRFDAQAVLVSDGPRPTSVASCDGQVLTAQPRETTIVDRVGAGDALVGGFLHGFLNGDIAMGLRLGMAATALALTRHGDQVRTTVDELENLAASSTSNIVR